jgi:hypothetical protein
MYVRRAVILYRCVPWILKVYFSGRIPPFNADASSLDGHNINVE